MSSKQLFLLLFLTLIACISFFAGWRSKTWNEKGIIGATCEKCNEIPECEYGHCPQYEFGWDLDEDGQWESFINVPTSMNKGGGEIWVIEGGKLVFKTNSYANIHIFMEKEEVFVSYVSEYDKNGIYPAKSAVAQLVYGDGKYQLIETEENQIRSAESFVSDGEYYEYFLDSNELTAIEPRYENLTGKGKQAIFVSVGKGCGSCHYNEAYIFDGRNKIFTFYGENVVLTPIIGKGFTITQPVSKDGQPYSERNEYQTATYSWNGETFVRTQSSLNWPADPPQTRY